MTASYQQPSFDHRLQELEIVVMHLQKMVEDLNEAVLLQHRKIDILSRQLEQAKDEVRSVLGSDSPRSLADDKPPHY